MPHKTYLGEVSPAAQSVLDAFTAHRAALGDAGHTTVVDVIRQIRPDLARAGWQIAEGTRNATGPRLRTALDFVAADARHPDGSALWLEIGRAWINNAFLQHVMEAAMAREVEHGVIAVVDRYRGPTYERCSQFLDDLFATSGLIWPLSSLTLVAF